MQLYTTDWTNQVVRLQCRIVQIDDSVYHVINYLPACMAANLQAQLKNLLELCVLCTLRFH